MRSRVSTGRDVHFGPGESAVSAEVLRALMIAIRTVLGWAMVLEVRGRWPYQKKSAAGS